MKVQVVAFGITKDILGSRNVRMDLAGPVTVGEFRLILENRFTGLKQLKSLGIAINDRYTRDSMEINDNDEIVLIPPVSGG